MQGARVVQLVSFAGGEMLEMRVEDRKPEIPFDPSEKYLRLRVEISFWDHYLKMLPRDEKL